MTEEIKKTTNTNELPAILEKTASTTHFGRQTI